jgi:hypothetical protein
MEKETNLRHEVRDVLVAGKLPTVTVPRSLLSDVYQMLVSNALEIEKLQNLLDIARDDRYTERRRHSELWGLLMNVIKPHACECEEQCENEPAIPSYCGWAAKQALEGKL